ncbi:MAG: TonB-dependent receptor [Novosphingobium sp.]
MKGSLLLAASAVALMSASQAFAQEQAAPQATETAPEEGGVGEIIVTATKRSESMQKVPISVLAASGDQMKSMGITNPRELTAVLPAVKISLSPIGNFAFIRGIGTPGINQGMEQSVSIFHDGIYMGRSQLSRAPFLDVERVEVLRGPQSILFGKNTIGGAIHVINKKPSDKFEAELTGLYGSFEERELTATLNVPVTTGVAARLSFRKYDTNGYVDNVMTGNTAGKRDEWTLRGQLGVELGERTKVNLKWEHSQFDEGEKTTQLAVFNPFSPTAAAFSGLNTALVANATGGSGAETWDLQRAVANDGGVRLGQLAPAFRGLPGFPTLPESSTNKMDLGTMTIDQEIGDATLTSVTGYAQYSYRDICDCDFAAVPLIQVDAREKYDQFTQELRLTSPKGTPIEYIVGGYYHHANLDYRAIDSFGSSMAYGVLGLPTPLLLPNLTRDYTFKQKQTMWSVFGSATWNATDTTRLTVGLRWFKDSKQATHVLEKSFTGGWDYSALAALPPGTIAFGNTPAEYDRFLASAFGQTPIAPGAPTPGGLTEAVYAGLLGTQEHTISGRRSESKLNWTATLQHDFAPTSMGYATVSNGTKGGGFDARYLRDSANTGGYFSYAPESATSYEVGLKSKLFGNKVRLNVAAFLMDVKNFQVSVFDGATGFLVTNAAKARTKGVELEFAWAATDHLTISASGSILDASWLSFPNAPCWQSPASPIRGACIGFGTPAAHRDASGGSMAFAPKFSGNFNAAYKQPVSDQLEVGASVNVSYSSGYFNSSEGDPIYMFQPKQAKIDARLSLGQVDGKWEIAVIGKNLTDQLTSFNSNNQPLVPGNGFRMADRPRSYAVQAKLSF